MKKKKWKNKVRASININSRKIGTGYPVYIIAEMSANHNHDFDQAVRIIEAAKEAGVDAIKLQTYSPDTMTINVTTTFFKSKALFGRGKAFMIYMERHTLPGSGSRNLKRSLRN